MAQDEESDQPTGRNADSGNPNEISPSRLVDSVDNDGQPTSPPPQQDTVWEDDTTHQPQETSPNHATDTGPVDTERDPTGLGSELFEEDFGTHAADEQIGEDEFDNFVEADWDDASDEPFIEGEEAEDFIEQIETSQEYIKITPVREEVDTETVTRELYGLHRYGDGRKLPLDLELHINSITPVSNFEFIIHKPEGEPQFQFYIGPGERGDASCDRLESVTRSQYPENFEFKRKEFDITTVFDEVPHMVRWEGLEERRKDWMTTLTTFDMDASDRSPLSNLLETIIQSEGSVVFQVAFEPRSDWSAKAQRQKGRLKQGVHTAGGLVLRTIADALFGVSDEEKRERHRGDTPQDIGGTIHDTEISGPRSGASRMGQIDLKDPSHTYNVTLRAAASTKRCAKNLQDSLNHLSGQFYTIDGNYLGQNEPEYERMLEHGLTYSNGLEMFSRRKPLLVCNIKELASFITVPSINSLPKASRGGTGGKPAAQSPLTSPNEEVFREFSHGMTIGHAVTALRDREQDEQISTIDSKNKWWNKLNRRDAISLSAGDLTQHYIRAATTGSGKTVATLNDMLSAHKNLQGPTILIDPKDGEMCQNYLRCHRTLFGDLDDVEYIKIPEKDGKVPGIPFFDLRPLVRGAGRERETAKQDLIDHYFQLLRFVLGRETVEQAFVANEILTNLIKALFDEEHGSDYFSIGELMEAAQDYQQHGKNVEDLHEHKEHVRKAMPKVSDDQVRSILYSHLQKDSRQFMNTTDAVLNRIRKLKERDFIWDMLSYTIDEEYWDETRGWYDHDEVPMLDMKNILNSNKVLMIDTGALRGESSEVFSVLFLSHLWTSAQSVWTPGDEDYIANVIIEESANIARNEIVYRELLPKGREFNLSLGLIMQYPEQVLGEDPHANRRAYKEILNNINTKIIGNVATDDLLANSLFHEDLEAEEIKDRIAGLRRGEWVVQLPSTGFNKSKPEILTLTPLPIPPGHSEGPFDVTSEEEMVRFRSRSRHCVGRDHPSIDNHSGNQMDDDYDDEEDEEEPEVEDGDLDYKHRAFLELVYDALTDGVNGYTLGSSMMELNFSDAAPYLVEQDYLKELRMGRNQIYYEPQEKAGIEIDRDLNPKGGGEKGSESIEHRILTRAVTTYYAQQGYETSMYHSPDGKEIVLDSFAKPTTDSPDDRPKNIEVETTPEHISHVQGDYTTLAMEEGDAIWVVKDLEAATKLMNCLSEYLHADPPTRHPSIKKYNEFLSDNGANKILTVKHIFEEI